mgnify:CR=1 FL=1
MWNCIFLLKAVLVSIEEMKLEIQEISSVDLTMKMTWQRVNAQKCFRLESNVQSSSTMKDCSSSSDK